MLRNYESAQRNIGRLIVSNKDVETISDTERIEMIVQRDDDMDLDVSFLISQGLILNLFHLWQEEILRSQTSSSFPGTSKNASVAAVASYVV
jgi:hypothetical protein